MWDLLVRHDEYIIPSIGLVWLMFTTLPHIRSKFRASPVEQSHDARIESPIAESPAKDPPRVRPCGGEDLSLEIRPSFTASYYGYGWLSGDNVTRSTKFNLLFTERHHIRKGDVVMIRLADLNPPHLNQLMVWDDNYAIVHKDASWGERLHRYAPTEWLQLRVEIRANGIEGSWEHSYRFRLTGRETFEVEEV